MSTEIIKKADSILGSGLQSRMSIFQLKHFVIEKEPTHQAKMWRCLQELESRRSDLNSILLEIEELKDQKDLLDIEIKHHEGNLGIDLPSSANELGVAQTKITIRRLKRKLQSLEATLNKLNERQKQSELEASFFIGEFEKLDRMEKCKPFDDPEAQLEYWNESYRRQFNMNLLLGRPIDPELVKLILCLDDKAPIKQQTVSLLQKIANPQETKQIEGD